MVAGDPSLRNFSVGIQSTEASRRQRAIGFNCLNYMRTPESFLQRRALPNKEEMKLCKDGLRADIAFPNCWDGLQPDSFDHRVLMLLTPSMFRVGLALLLIRSVSFLYCTRLCGMSLVTPIVLVISFGLTEILRVSTKLMFPTEKYRR